VANARINTAGYGPEKPIASNDTEDGRAKSRRLELVVEKR
jgi:OOP family OmpA-OmpF porin